MEYARISLGPRPRLTIDGVECMPSTDGGPHMSMDEWQETRVLDHWLRTDTVYHEWPTEPNLLVSQFQVLGYGVQLYQERFVSTELGTITKRRYYACEDVKERIERDFDELVVPIIRRDAPHTLPQRGKFGSFGFLDPRVDRFPMPANIDKDDLPCIELKRGTATTMPIEAMMPPVSKRGRVMFWCRMRYSAEGRLRKAECTIIRRQGWLVVVSFGLSGVGKVSSAKMTG